MQENLEEIRVKLFCSRLNATNEMQRFQKLREENPEKCKSIFQNCEEMIKYASNGSLSRFKRAVMNTHIDDMFQFFSHKMFIASLLNNHFMITSIMLDEDYNVNMTGKTCPLHECLSQVNDEIGCNIVEFLITRSKVDVNTTDNINKTYETALHVAVRRQLPSTVSMLINLGADVDAVANHDSMPLPMAKVSLKMAEMTQDKEGYMIAHRIVTDLLAKNARETWRKGSSSEENDRRGVPIMRSSEGGVSVSISSNNINMRTVFTGNNRSSSINSSGSAIAHHGVTSKSVSKSITDGAKCKDEDNSDSSASKVYAGVSSDGALLFSTG